jgi:hypothetical protein
MRHAHLLLTPADPNIENTGELPNSIEKLQDEPGPQDRTPAESFDDDLSVADEGSDADSRLLGVCRISARTATFIYMAKHENNPRRGDRLAARLSEKFGITSKAVRDIWNLRTWARTTRSHWTHHDHIKFRNKKLYISCKKAGKSIEEASPKCNVRKQHRRVCAKAMRHKSTGETAGDMSASVTRRCSEVDKGLQECRKEAAGDMGRDCLGLERQCEGLPSAALHAVTEAVDVDDVERLFSSGIEPVSSLTLAPCVQSVLTHAPHADTQEEGLWMIEPRYIARDFFGLWREWESSSAKRDCAL